MIDAIEEEARAQEISADDAICYLVQRNTLYAKAVAAWLPSERRFIANHVRWYREHQYRQDEAQWQRATKGGIEPPSKIKYLTEVEGA